MKTTLSEDAPTHDVVGTKEVSQHPLIPSPAASPKATARREPSAPLRGAATGGGIILPEDAHNRELIRQTHPSDWINPTPTGRYNLVVIGAGTAGLTAAGGCAAIGGRVAIIERHLTGGDCLLTGCVPSKGIISAARAAAAVREAETYGVRVPRGTTVDFPAVMERMRRLRARIAAADSVHHLKESGVDVYLGQAKFTGPDTVTVDGKTLRFAKCVIASGGRAVEPPIPGLKEAGCLTNETLFELTELPRRFVVIGGGPIGCEMAQTFRRLGSEVTQIDQAAHFLPREDADAAEILQRQFEREGITLLLGAHVARVERTGLPAAPAAGASRAAQAGDERRVVVECQGKTHTIACDAILVGVGRRPNVEGLDLEPAGVAYDKHGITVNDKLQTTNPRIYAAGDISSRYKFTHTANALGRMAMTNALFWGFGGRASGIVVPWCTYTDPEIAHVGLYEHQAKEQGSEVVTLTQPLAENDRAILDGQDEGFIRVHLKQGTDRILGATIVAAHAGDLLTYFTYAMVNKKGLSSLAWPIYPYPTQGEALKKLAGQYLGTKLSPRVKGVLGWLLARRR